MPFGLVLSIALMKISRAVTVRTTYVESSVRVCVLPEVNMSNAVRIR